MASMLTTRLPEAEAVLGMIHNSTNAIKDFGSHLVEGQNGTLMAMDASTIGNWLIVSTIVFVRASVTGLAHQLIIGLETARLDV